MKYLIKVWAHWKQLLDDGDPHRPKRETYDSDEAYERALHIRYYQEPDDGLIGHF